VQHQTEWSFEPWARVSDDAVNQIDNADDATETQLELGDIHPETTLDLAQRRRGALPAGMNEQRSAIAEGAGAVLHRLHPGDDRPSVGLANR